MEQESNLGPGSVTPVRYPLDGGPFLFRGDSKPAMAGDVCHGKVPSFWEVRLRGGLKV